MAKSRAQVGAVAHRPAAHAPLAARGAVVLSLTAGFVLTGLAVSFVGLTDVRVLLIALLGIGAVFGTIQFGMRALVTASMMAVAVTAPMNGVRAYGNLALTDVFLIVAAVGLLALHTSEPSDRPALPVGLTGGIALLVAGGSLGTLFADNATVSALNLLRFTLAAVLPILVVRAWGPDTGTIRSYTWLWVAGAAVSGVVGLLSAGDVSGRPAGLATHPNHLAMISAMSAGLALMLAMSDHGRRRWVATGMFGILAFSVVRAGSRAGLVALIVVTVVVVVRTRPLRAQAVKARRLAALWTLAILALALLTVGGVELGQHNAVARLLGDDTSLSSDTGRSAALIEGINGIDERPLTGSGLEFALGAHNIYVQVWASAGLIGFAGLCLIAWTTVRSGLRPQASGARAYLATAFVAGYIGYLVAGLSQNFLWDRYLWLTVAMILWIGISTPDHKPSHSHVAER